MKIEGVPPQLIKALCVQQFLRQLGVPEDSLVLAPVVETGDLYVQVREPSETREEGRVVITLDCDTRFDIQTLGPAWAKARRVWSRSDIRIRRAIWTAFIEGVDAESLLEDCARAGLVEGQPMPWEGVA